MIHSDVELVEICENNFFLLHMLTITITLSTISSGYSELYCQSGARSVASRKLGVAKRSGCSETERSAEQEVTARQQSGGYRNRLERIPVVAFSPLTWSGCLFSIVFIVSYFWCIAHWVHSSSRICYSALSASVHYPGRHLRECIHRKRLHAL